MIKFERVTKIYHTKDKRKVVALENVSFEIEKGEFVMLVGPSGAGKTTVLRLICAEERPTEGMVFFEDRNIAQMDDKNIAQLRRKIGVVFQDYKLLRQRNAFENLSFIMEVTGFSDSEIKENVPEILELVGLENKIWNFPDELSAGEKQRLSIARALAHRPEVILADEPTGNLDPNNTFEILKILKRINELGTTVLLATHDREVVNFLRRRVLYFENGKLIKDQKGGKILI